MAEVTERQIRRELETMRDRIDDLVKVILSDRIPEGLVKRKVPPLQEDLLLRRAPGFLDATAALLLKATDGCTPDMKDPDIEAHVIGTIFDNQDFAEIDADNLVRGIHELVLCLDLSERIPQGVNAYTLTLANVVALARIGAQSLLDI